LLHGPILERPPSMRAAIRRASEEVISASDEGR
jgi:hypothetical protein